MPHALVENKVYSISALTKTIDFELFSSPGFPKGNSPSLERRRNARSVLSNKKVDDEECESCFVNNPRLWEIWAQFWPLTC